MGDARPRHPWTVRLENSSLALLGEPASGSRAGQLVEDLLGGADLAAPPSIITRSGIAQRRSSAIPSSPALRAGIGAEHLRWEATSLRPWTVRTRKRRYSPVRGLPPRRRPCFRPSGAPWKLRTS